MKIAILEFETHSPLLFLWNELLQDSDIEYTFFVSEVISNQIKKIPNSKKKVLSIDFNIQELQVLLTSYNLVIFNTLHRNFEKYNSILSSQKTLILVHNANFYFHSKKPKWNLLFKVNSLSLIYYYLKLIFKEKVYKTKNVIYKAAAYGFLNTQVLAKNKIKGKQNFVIPLVFNQYMNTIKNEDKIKIVIPGNVSQARRNYFLLFNILKNLNPKEKLEFIFLGQSKNSHINKVLNHLKNSLHSSIQITYFEEWISQEEFAKQMNDTHFILCPLHKETQFYLQKETYGETKVSGNEADCISYGKIGIFPEYYPVNNWTSLYYKNENELKILLENLTFEQYYFYQQELTSQKAIFSKDNAKKELLEILTFKKNT